MCKKGWGLGADGEGGTGCGRGHGSSRGRYRGHPPTWKWLWGCRKESPLGAEHQRQEAQPKAPGETRGGVCFRSSKGLLFSLRDKIDWGLGSQSPCIAPSCLYSTNIVPLLPSRSWGCFSEQDKGLFPRGACMVGRKSNKLCRAVSIQRW